MASDDTTRFEFDYAGVKVDISGERDFVEKLSRMLMRDIERVRSSVAQRRQARDDEPDDELIWVQKCSRWMRRIYMGSIDHLETPPLRPALDVSALGTVYVDKEVFEKVLPDFVDQSTLLAELTDEGRKKIEG